MTTSMLLIESSSLVPPPPSFYEVPAGLSLPAYNLPAISPLLRCSSCPSHLSWLSRASARYIFPARPLSLLFHWFVPVSVRNNIVPDPAQPKAPNLSTVALETIPSARAAQSGSVGVGTENVPPTPTSPIPVFHDDAIEFGSQAPPAQPQAVSRSQDQPFPYSSCIHGSTSVSFQISGSLAFPRPVRTQ